MPEFHYAALNDKGQRYAGVLDAESKTAALKTLTDRFPVVTRLEPKAGPGLLKPLFSPIKGEDVLSFAQTLAAMLEGGIPLKRSLDTIYHDVENKAMREVLMDLSTQLGTGTPLSEALKQHPLVFDKFFTSMVKAGEDSGSLPEMLHRVSEYVEKTEKLKDEVKSALTYPLVILVFAACLVAAILGFGIPYLRDLYDGLGMELPWSTQILVVIGGLMGDNVIASIFSVVLLLYLTKIGLSNPKVRLWLDALRLRLPKVGSFFRVLYTARFARTLALLYASGVPLLNAIKLAGDSVGNHEFAKTMEAAEDEIKAGAPLSECLRENPYFLDSAVGMVSAGEESGKLDAMLEKVANFYEHKVNSQLQSLTATIEPIMMILIGLVIGGIIIALGLPFLNLASQI